MPESYDLNPSNAENEKVAVPSFKMKAEEDIPFGKLISRGAAETVKLTSSNEDKVLGVGAQYAATRVDKPTGYNKSQEVIVKALLPGKIYLLCAAIAVGNDEYVCCTADGNIEEIKPDPENSYKIIGVSLESIEAGAWGKGSHKVKIRKT
ncbi:MAG: hypothetical protein ABIH20_01810 [Candidatus Diapherotrites archaeon]